MSFTEEYKSIKELIKPELNILNEEILSGVENILNLKDYINSPSKQIRPVLAFLYLKALGEKITPEQIKLQAAVELIHNASLIHDDIIDESKIRRKNISLNEKEGNHLAVIGGDLILSYALNKLIELNSIDLIRLFSNTLKLMCKGEIVQQMATFKIPALNGYLEKTYQKTGALFETAVNGGILISGQKGKSSGIGKNFGIAFQIRDDILNITQNREDSDIKNGIYTAPVIFSGSPENPAAGIEKAKDLLNNYIEKITSGLSKLPDNEYKRALIKLTEILKYE